MFSKLMQPLEWQLNLLQKFENFKLEYWLKLTI